MRGVAQRKCGPVRVLIEVAIAASRLTWANDGVKVEDELRPLDPDDGSKCHLL